MKGHLRVFLRRGRKWLLRGWILCALLMVRWLNCGAVRIRWGFSCSWVRRFSSPGSRKTLSFTCSLEVPLFSIGARMTIRSSLHEIGRVKQVQVQRSSLKVGERPHAYYDPTPLFVV